MKTKLSDQPWYAKGDQWVLTPSEWVPAKNIYYETIFTQANGYMGIRAYTEEANDGLRSFREGYLAGVFGHVDEAALAQMRVNYEWPALAMVTLPELFTCSVALNGETFKLSEGTIAFFSRSLNMRNGLLSRHVVWESPTGLRTRLLFERFLSAADPHLGMQQITVMPENWSGKVRAALAASIPALLLPSAGGSGASRFSATLQVPPDGIVNFPPVETGAGVKISLPSLMSLTLTKSPALSSTPSFRSFPAAGNVTILTR